MLKITTTEGTSGPVMVEMMGNLTQEGCAALDEVLKGALEQHQLVRVDLAGIRLVDRASVEYLAGLRQSRVAVTNMPSYIRLWIEQLRRQRPR